MHEEESRHGAYDSVIIGPVMTSKKLEPNAKLLYGQIRSLCYKCGYCYAKNEYLAEILGVTDRTIKNLLCSLQEAGFIEIETTKKGMIWDRKIYLSEIKIYSTKGKFFPDRRENFFPIEGKKISSSPYKSNKELVVKSPMEIERAHGKFVKLTESAYEKLCAERTKKKVDAMIERMNDYCAMTGKKYKDYAIALKKWFKSDDEKPDTESHGTPSVARKEKSDENQKLAKKVEKQFPEQVRKGYISIGHNYIEFVSGPYCTQILFSDFGFREQVETRLRQMKLPWDELLWK